MGAIDAEKLDTFSKMPGAMFGREEKILVLVRLRPLNEKEISKNEVVDWECINESTILYRNSLQERSGLPTVYSFDRVFSGDCSTKEVYEEGTKEVALSVVSGINSSIFAYGQTSSGKTYTMNGITEYTVADIYDFIQRHEERAFVLKFSAMEIYNENVRDLLSTDSAPLRILDDAEKGTIVEKLTEETLTDWNHLKKLISICEVQRKIGETSLNEQSSRSHQILKLTIESSAREFIGKENSSTLSASVFFIDLAGSERASQAMSAGARLKEGCHINRSLLTLGNVIRKLSKGRQGHINYRDSKLTRILQPCLGGNARTSIICTLSPARSHVEQSRNTLLFASCAKEVTTNAHVNVVMSDKALVKHLQKELARLENELRSPAPTSSSCKCSVVLKKKDLQIEKMEKEIRALTNQRDLAQSRVEDLLQLIGNDKSPITEKESHKHRGKWKAQDKWEDEYSFSESSVNGRNCGESPMEDPSLPGIDHEDESDSEMADSDEGCKDVRCIELEESGADSKSQFHVSPRGGNGQMSTSSSIGSAHVADNGILTRSGHQNGFPYATLEERIGDVQRSTKLLANSCYETLPPWDDAADGSSSRSPIISRSHSGVSNLDNCLSVPPGKQQYSERVTPSGSENIFTGRAGRLRKLPRTASGSSAGADFINDTKSIRSGEEVYSETTPPSEVEKDFRGKPGGLRSFSLPDYDAKSPKLSRNGSQSSAEGDLTDYLKSPSSKNMTDEEITSVHAFVARLKDAKVQYEKQLEADEVLEELKKTLRDVGLDPMHSPENSLDWPLQFEKMQRAIIELWHACNVSLVHRTYFFLLFKGDPTDSIYLEVELRRLTFLKDTFCEGNHGVKTRQGAQTLASSEKALRRERATLSKFINKRYSDDERKRLYQKWGIMFDSKRRRLQLISKLWTETENMDHISESAAIVGRLVKFSEQGRALKGMFGLSFSPPGINRRTSGWKLFRDSLL